MYLTSMRSPMFSYVSSTQAGKVDDLICFVKRFLESGDDMLYQRYGTELARREL